MDNNLYNEYKNILNYLNEIKEITSDSNLKNNLESNMEKFIKKLYEKDKTNVKNYEELIKKYNLKLELNSTKSNNFEKYEREIENIFKNPNKESIKVWLQNIYDYSKFNNISKEELKTFIYSKFEELDIKNEFKNDLEGYIKEIENEEAKSINHEITENKEEINKKNNDVISNAVEDINKDEKNVEKSNEKDSKEHKKELDESKVSKKEKENESLKILKVKRGLGSKLRNKILGVTALVGLCSVSMPLAAGVFAGYLYKKGIRDVKKIIEKNNLSIDEAGNLIDKNGKTITKEDVGNIKYSLIRRQLNKVNNSKGNIDKGFKKNRLTQLLLGNSLVKSLKDKYDYYKYNNDAMPELVKDINKGMRKV